MKKHARIILSTLLIFLLPACSEDGLGKYLGLSDQTIVEGLKKALEIGINESVVNLSGKNGTAGFFNDETVKILLPDEARPTFDLLRQIDNAGGSQLLSLLGVNLNLEGTLVELINRAAEDAVPEATSIFINALTDMTISNGKDILLGTNNAATTYLESKTYSGLETSFGNVISTSLSSDNIKVAGYTPIQAWEAFSEVNNKITTITSNPVAALAINLLPANLQNEIRSFHYVEPDLGRYVTQKALDGLFDKVAEKELQIRTDISARTTPLLQQVFAQQDNK